MKQGKATTFQDRSGKCLTEERQILNRWTEYCCKLYNYKANGDPSVLNCPQTDTEDDHPILRREVEAALQLLKKGSQLESAAPEQNWFKQVEHDNLQQDLASMRMDNPVDPVLSHHTSQESQPAAVPYYRTISLISHPSKVLLKIILNRLKSHAEIIADEQAGFRAGRSTTEQIFNLHILCEKYPQHQQDLYHVFIEEVQHQHKPYPSHQKPL